MKHEYSLAHLTVLSLTPPQLVDVAARTGYEYVGVRITRVTPQEVLYDLARDRTLVEFVKRVSEISRGKAYFTSTMTLGQFILMDFLKRKTRKVS